MAEVRIPVKQFVARSFPATCAVTGLPAQELFEFTFGGVKGGLPLHGRAARLIRQQQLTIKVLAAVTLFVFLLAAALQSTPLGFGAAGTAAIVLANYGSIRQRLPRGTVDGKEMKLVNVHTDFVDALRSGGGHKCAGCPTAGTCETEKVDACEGFDAKTATAPSAP